MIRTLAAAAAAAAALALAGAASAQTWGQPVYLNAYGQPVGGSPLSEVETRSHVATGLRADGYSDRPQVYVPAPGYGQGYGYSHGYGRGHSNYGHRGYDRPSRPGYRDEWGYNDDRPPSSRRWSDDGRTRHRDRDCRCSEVYLYDR